MNDHDVQIDRSRHISAKGIFKKIYTKQKKYDIIFLIIRSLTFAHSEHFMPKVIKFNMASTRNSDLVQT